MPLPLMTAGVGGRLRFGSGREFGSVLSILGPALAV